MSWWAGPAIGISLVSFPADASVNALIDGLVPSDVLSWSAKAIPPGQSFVVSAQPQQNQMQIGLSSSAQPTSAADLPHFVLRGQPTFPQQIRAPKGVILLGDPSVTGFSVSLSNSKPGQFGTQFVAAGPQPPRLSFASPGLSALGLGMTHQLLLTDVGSAGSNFTFVNSGTSTGSIVGSIGFDQSINQIMFLSKPAGSSPDTVRVLRSQSRPCHSSDHHAGEPADHHHRPNESWRLRP